MGWKASAGGKRLVCASATTHGLEGNALTVAFDMNAVLRRDFVMLKASVSPRAAVRMFWKRRVMAHAGSINFFFAFDSPDKIPNIRLRFLGNVRYRYGQPAPPERWTITPDVMSVTWGQAFASSATKAAVWNAVAISLVDHIKQMAAPGVSYVVDPPVGDLYAWPHDTPTPNNHYGEADLKVAAYLAERTEPAVMETIDWDAVVQGAMIFNAATVVALGAVFKDGGSIFYSARKAPPDAERVVEVVRPHGLPGPVAWAPEHRWSFGFALLAVGGIDYCEGLKRFGYTEGRLIRHITENGVPQFFTVTDSPRVISFDVELFRDWLLPVTPQRARTTAICDLEREMHDLLYCTLYLALVDPNRPRGGPKEMDWTFFPNASDSVDALRVRQPLDPITYTEEYP